MKIPKDIEKRAKKAGIWEVVKNWTSKEKVMAWLEKVKRDEIKTRS